MVKDEANGLAGLKTALAERLGTQRYELWFGPPTRLSLCDSGLRVRVASTFVRDWIRKHVHRDIKACGHEVLGLDLSIDFEVDGSLLLVGGRSDPPSAEKANRRLRSVVSGSADNASSFACRECTSHTDDQQSAFLAGNHDSPGTPLLASPLESSRVASKNASISERLTFETLAVGNSNRFAVNSAQMVGSGLHQAALVLFFGPTGVGKTHLLRATRSAYRQTFARARAVYLTAEQFTGSFVEAVRGSGLPSFRQKCRGADVLLIDDIHFLAGKRATLDEFLHTIDSLSSVGRRIVFSSDRAVGELQSLGAELVSRLSAGITCEIEPPDFELRVAILREHCRRLSMTLPDDVLRSIATCITSGARELLGALHRLQLVSTVEECAINVPLVEQALQVLAQQNVQAVRLADIQKAICEVFGVEPSGLRSESKARAVSEPRMLAMWLARKYTRAPWSEIGEFFGRRSHSTVISAHRRVENLVGNQGTVDIANRICRVEDAIRRVEAVLRRA